MSKQFVMCPSNIISSSDLNSYEKTIYTTLCKHYNLKTKHCSPTISDLIKETGFNKMTILKYLDLLFQKGYILIIKKKQRNYYRIAWFETNKEKVKFEEYKVSAVYKEYKRTQKRFKKKLNETLEAKRKEAKIIKMTEEEIVNETNTTDKQEDEFVKYINQRFLKAL